MFPTFQLVDRAMFHVQNACFVPNITVRGHMCRTNTVSNTAFRGFGGPQGMLVGEAVYEQISVVLGKPAEDVCPILLSISFFE